MVSLPATMDGSPADDWGNEMGEDFVRQFGYSGGEETTWGRIKAGI